MKIDGIALLQMIKDNKLKDNTRIDISYLDAPINYVVAKLTYKNEELNWEPGTFRVSMLYDDYYTFEIIEDKPKKIEEIPIQTNRTVRAKDKFIENMFNHFYKLDLETRNKLNEIIKDINYLLENSVYSNEEMDKKISDYIDSISIEEKENIFDYYEKSDKDGNEK